MKQGVIVSAYGGKYTVVTNGQSFLVSPRGSVTFIKGELLPGDIVDFEETTATIEALHERINRLPRPRVSNISQMMIMASAVEPLFSPLLVYKTMTYALMYGIKPFVVISKIDCLDNLDEVKRFREQLALIGYEAILYSKKSREGLLDLQAKLKNNITLAIGQTGVGKSSLINLLDASFNRAIGEYSQALGRGKHKTKEVVFLPYHQGFIVDSPGFSSLELDLFKEDLAVNFPGFAQALGKCFYNDCHHINEKGCEVKRLLKADLISKEAYLIYQKLYDELQYKNKRFQK